MKQCKRILENGEQCSNRAVPGTAYCQTHRQNKIKFKKIQSPAKLDSRKKENKSHKKKHPEWFAEACAAGADIMFPGLFADNRNIIVAPKGLVWFPMNDQKAASQDSFEPISRFLSFMSQVMPLAVHTSVFTVSDHHAAIVKLSPPDTQKNDLSKYYDTALSAAEFCNGDLFIGDKNLYISYRDHNAPRGYDASNVKKPDTKDHIYLVHKEGTTLISANTLNESLLKDIILRIKPVQKKNDDLPFKAYALVALPIYQMLARYFRSHQLNYKLARFYSSENKTRILFEITPQPDSPTGERLPAFILSYLTDLPFCVVFTEVYSGLERQILVEWKMRHPCLPQHIAEIFPENSMVLLSTNIDFSSVCIKDRPTFFSGDDLIHINLPQPQSIQLSPVDDDHGLTIEIPLRIVPDTGPLMKTSAIVLDKTESQWIKRLLYRLPGNIFESYKVCFGSHYGILTSESAPVETLPFGIPMQRIKDSQLYIPVGTKLKPDLPWAPLAKTLNLKENMATFLTHDLRLDILQKDFYPLSYALVAECSRPAIEFHVQTAQALPELTFTPMNENNQKDASDQPVSTGSREVNPKQDQSIAPEDTEKMIQSIVSKCIKSNDFIGAAVCSALSGDRLNAARYYHKALNTIKQKGVNK